MAKKEKSTYSMDAKVVSDFKKICKQNGVEYSETIEDLMKVYIEKSGQILLDDIYAPRINELMNRTMEKQFDRIAGMIYNINVDVGATLQLMPSVYKKTMVSIENTLNEFINEQLLVPERESLADQFMVGREGQTMITTARNVMRKEMNERRLKDIQEKKEAAAAAN